MIKELVFCCIIDIYSKYAWAIPLKDKNDTTITNVFQNNLDESGRKPNIIWVYKGYMLLVMRKVKKLLGRFTKKNCKKQIKNNLG